MSTTLGKLKEHISLWLGRNDATAMQSFVQMAEAEFRRDERLIGALSNATASGSVVDGVIAVPSDLLQLKELRVNGVLLIKKPRSEVVALAAGNYFSQLGAEYRVVGEPSGDWSMVYDRAIESLTEATGSNWLLENAFDVYLWKCCELGSVFAQDEAAATGYNAKYEMAVNQMVAAKNIQEWGGAPLTVSAPGVV